jgi:hypothetical protein
MSSWLARVESKPRCSAERTEDRSDAMFAYVCLKLFLNASSLWIAAGASFSHSFLIAVDTKLRNTTQKKSVPDSVALMMFLQQQEQHCMRSLQCYNKLSKQLRTNKKTMKQKRQKYYS